MRRLLLFTLLTVLMISFCSSIFAQVTVTLGDGTGTNTYTGAPAPYGTWYKNFRQQYLVLATELNDIGGGPGNINSVAFDVQNLNECTPMPNFRIRMKTTTQTALTSTFEAGTYTEVFQAAEFMPVTGWNTHTFSTPFNWDGAANLLIEVVTDLIPGNYAQNASVSLTPTTFASSLRYQSDTESAINGTTGTTTMTRSNMQLNMAALDITDLNGMTITGPTTPNVNSTVNYTVSVKNYSLTAVSNYTVKLMKTGGVEIASVPGTAINPQQTLEFTLPWTPTVIGETQLYGKVVMAGDENPANDETNYLTVNVMEAGLLVVEVGNGTGYNGTTGTPTPYGTFYKAQRQQYLYTAADMYAAGAAPGLISSMAFNVQAVNTCSAMPNYTIRLKHTDQTALTSTFEEGDYTTVVTYDSYMPTADWNMHVFSNPFFWNGGSNLIVELVTDVIPGTYTQNASVYYTPTSYNSALRFQSDTAAGSTGTTGSTSMNRANTRFFMSVSDMGSLNGTVTSGGSPLAGATVAVNQTVFTAITAADGTYNIPFVPVGAQTVTASKHGYIDVTNNVTIVEDQATTSNFVLNLLPQVTVTGRIVGSDAPTVGIADATITLSGYEPYEATTNASGQFTIANVFANQTYNYTALALGYAAASGQVVVAGANVNMGDVIVNEVAFPPHSLVATESTDYQHVNLTWEAPVPGGTGEWIHYDSGENNDSIGTGAAADFDVAIRFPASALTDYAGMSLHALKVWPAQAGTFSLRVWTGGTPTTPGTMVVDQPFTPVLDTYNTIELDNPVPITGTEELWFGYRCNVTSGYPAGSDAGPAIDGFGNMMYFDGAWSTLLTIAPTLNYNWNIQGYVGFSAPDRGELIAISKDSVKLPALQDGPRATTIGSFKTESGNSSSLRSAQVYQGHSTSKPATMDRSLQGYHVYRLLAADQANEANWTTLTPPNGYGQTSFADNAWGPLPSGVYKYAVKALYTNNVLSPAIFSAELHKGMMGILEGTVTEFGTGIAIEGATVTAGEYSGTTDVNGDYSFAVYAGNYSVNATMGGYQPSVVDGVVIVGLQTTTLDFTLTEITLPPSAVNAEEAGANVNVTWTAPDPNAVDITEGFEGDTFPPEDWTQVITDTSAAGTTGVLPTWCQIGEVPLDPVVAPYAGEYQAGLWWSYNHQDEWLITPQFACPGNASLTFQSYIYYGSTNQDHYYVKVSTDNGGTWTTLWDATAQTGGWNYYASPVVVDLAAYTGQQIKLALHAEDPPSNDGLWYVWFVDEVVVGSPTQLIRFENATFSRTTFEDQHPNRSFEGYKVWRLLQGQESNEAAWTSLTANNISATAFQDTGWAGVSDGTYKWAVKAVYTGNAMSNAAFSNTVDKATEVGTIAGFVRNMQNQAISGATVTVGTHTATSNASGAYSLMNIPQGTHSVTASHPNYSAVTQNGVVVVTGQTTTVNFQLPASTVVLEDGFESYADFSLTFDPWVLVDVDQASTFGITNVSFPNSMSPMAYIIFNPSATTPATAEATAHGGQKYAASFGATTPPNNDWLITPQVSGGGELRFWAKSYTADYGLERFRVGVSTTGTAPADFTIISGANYVSAPVEWTEYEYDLSAYANQQIRVAIKCESNDAFIFFVDDVKITGPGANPGEVTPLVTSLKGNYPNPFNPETTISYSVKDNSPVSIDIFNVKGQKVRRLVNEVKNAGNHTVIWNGTDDNGRAVSSGVYYFKMNAGKFSSTKKMIMMK